MIWLGLFPSVLFGYWFFTVFPFSFDIFYLLLLIPLFFVLYGIALLSSLVSTKIGIWLVYKLIVRPELGIYPLLMEETQSRAWVLKANIKHFGRWLFYFFHLEFLRIFWLRRMGLKIGKNVKLCMHLADDELQEVGDNTFMAHRTGFAAHTLEVDHLTIGKMKIGKNCIFEPISGCVQGTIGDNSIFTGVTAIMKGQIARGNAIYHGVPCKKVNDNNLTQLEILELKRKIHEFDRINFIKKKNAPIKINETKLFVMKMLIAIGGCLFAFLFIYLFSLLFQIISLYNNAPMTFVFLTLIPFVFIVSLGCFVLGTAIFTKIFLKYYNRKAEILEGFYELNDPRAKWFKIKYLLRLFGLRIFHGSPFRIADTFVLRFWGDVKFGKNIELDYALIDPQYLEVDDYSIIGTGVRIHTHDIIDDKLYIKKVKIGKRVLIGTFAHLGPGVEIADGSIIAVAAWMRKNRKTKKPALWVGKPAVELPLELIRDRGKKSTSKYID
jgi:acetyltransferase-like isoleucine patch superfamily enzyme